MTTELITFKLEEDFLKDVDELVKSQRFHSRTELIRSALREKVEEAKIKVALQQLVKLKGASSKKTSDDDLEKIRDKLFDELDKKIR